MYKASEVFVDRHEAKNKSHFTVIQSAGSVHDLQRARQQSYTAQFRRGMHDVGKPGVLCPNNGKYDRLSNRFRALFQTV